MPELSTIAPRDACTSAVLTGPNILPKSNVNCSLVFSSVL